MKKKFKLEDLDCANCAAKMEEAIKKIPGVNDANVSFMTQKMTVDAEDGQVRRHHERSRFRLRKGRAGLQDLNVITWACARQKTKDNSMKACVPEGAQA